MHISAKIQPKNLKLIVSVRLVDGRPEFDSWPSQTKRV